ncbi:alpha-crystallin A chain-like isoform X2 [Schistocerca serialis cubense]|uniref:alpha-crystallin A chain-like isoform X2 n=1 Tax=Schistocerca serialis cubense TaxID=2023355 RepID=UPI00214EB51C|nr:alpha-crystallin A chain-like isoform X2 [Schistocerca serialis cubense]
MDFCPLRALVEEHLPIADHGSRIFSDDMFIPRSITMPLRSRYLRSWRHQPIRRSGKSHIRKWKGGFEVNLDVQHFKPDEVSVKIRDDFIVIEGNHEERQDQHGFISRQFTRRYKLPENTDIDAVTSKLSSDGVLTIKAPKKAPLKDSTERVVPIVQTNKPAVTKAGHENPDDKQEKMEA